MDPGEPRRPHHRFRWFALSEALLDAPAFAAKYTATDGAARLHELWDAANAESPGDELSGEGLVLEVHGERTSPVVFVTLPVPERRNEAYQLAMIPTAATALAYRAFAIEKAVLPKTGAPLVFVVETTRGARRNFGPPADDRENDASRGAFVSAILEICDGKRQPLSSTTCELVDPAPALAKLRGS